MHQVSSPERAYRGRLSIAQLLVEKGSSVNAADAYGNTPVHFSSEYGHADILCWILERNPLLCVKNHEGRTPIDVAFNQEILQVTPAHKGSVNRYLALYV